MNEIQLGTHDVTNKLLNFYVREASERCSQALGMDSAELSLLSNTYIRRFFTKLHPLHDLAYNYFYKIRIAEEARILLENQQKIERLRKLFNDEELNND